MKRVILGSVMNSSILFREGRNAGRPTVFKLRGSFKSTSANSPPINHTNNHSFLFNAVESGDVRVVDLQLRHGFDPNSREPKNLYTPLMTAAENNQLGVLDILLMAGSDPNAQCALGETALMKAARDNHRHAVGILLRHGAQVDILNYEGMTAIDIARDSEVDGILREWANLN